MVAFGSGFGWNPASGETAAGSAGKQPAKGLFAPKNHWPASDAPMAYQALARVSRPGPLVLVETLDIGAIPPKIQASERHDALRSPATRPSRFHAINTSFYAAHIISRRTQITRKPTPSASR